MYNTLILYIQGRGYFKMFTNDEVINFLESSHPECEYLDYKRKGYQKGQRGNFIKDIISMLNTYNAYDRNRFIIIGVDDSGHLFGISESEKRDDNEYQNWVDKIYPVPTINTGHVIYKNMIFEVICVNTVHIFSFLRLAQKNIPVNQVPRNQNPLCCNKLSHNRSCRDAYKPPSVLLHNY